MSSVTDFPDWAPHVATADQIAATGVPLLTLSTELGNVTQSIGPSSSGSIGTFDLTQIGYEIMVAASIAGTATNPFPTVLLEWIDTASSIVVATDTFTATASTNILTPLVTIGRGFTKANSVQVTVSNIDTVQTLKVNVAVFQNSRVYPKEEFFWLNQFGAGITVPGSTLAELPPDENCLGIAADVTLAASASSVFLFGMYNGPILVGVAMTIGSLSSLSLGIAPEPTTIYLGHYSMYQGTPSQPSFLIGGPRAPIKMLIANLATTSIKVTVGLWRGQ